MKYAGVVTFEVSQQIYFECDQLTDRTEAEKRRLHIVFTLDVSIISPKYRNNRKLSVSEWPVGETIRRSSYS